MPLPIKVRVEVLAVAIVSHQSEDYKRIIMYNGFQYNPTNNA